MATLLRSASPVVSQTYIPARLRDRQPDPEPVRLITRLHLPNCRPVTANWRVVAELMDGHRRLVCVGSTPRDARASARRAGAAGELPPHTIALRMQRWVGGRWEEEG